MKKPRDQSTANRTDDDRPLDALRRWQWQQAQRLLRDQPSWGDEAVRAAVQSATLARLSQRRTQRPELTPETLSLAYERLLDAASVRDGSAITLLSDRRARKRAGAFYTPPYVVDYIVDAALDDWLRGKTAAEAASLRVLDPACGCGAFAVAVYRRLSRWYLEKYLEEGTAAHAAKLVHSGAGRPRLTFAERLAIVNRHVYGVDLDACAVETARGALALAIEEEDETAAADDAGCDRSVVLNFQAANALDDAQFDWAQAFPAVFSGPRPGFALIVGNPPYRRELACKPQLDALAATALGRQYRAPRMDLWHYFVHLALATLLQDGGQLSFITNSYWSAGRGAQKLIDHIRSAASIEEVFDLGERTVFPGVRGRHMIFRLGKGRPARPARIKCGTSRDTASAERLVRGEAPIAVFEKSPEQLFHGPGLDLLPPADAWLAKLAAHPPLVSLGIVRQGIAENPAAVNARTHRRFAGQWRLGEGVFSLSAEETRRLDLAAEEQALLRPYHDLCDIGRYCLADAPSRTLIYSTRQTCPDIERHPRLAAHLGRFRAIMEQRRETRLGKVAWWQLHWPRDEAVWRAAKIIALQMAARPSFAAAEGPTYVPFSANVFAPRPDVGEGLHYLTALLNSRTLWAWFCRHAKRRGVSLEINGHTLARCPIRRIDFASALDRARHDRLVELARKMAALAASRQDRQRMTELDAQIDAIVFDLYETSEGEVAAAADMG